MIATDNNVVDLHGKYLNPYVSVEHNNKLSLFLTYIMKAKE